VTGCGVFALWHRRKRRLDHETMWVTLRSAADTRYPLDPEEAVVYALRGWAAFIQQPGQEHWRCACAEADDQATLRRVRSE